jgi:hypothetical protein
MEQSNRKMISRIAKGWAVFFSVLLTITLLMLLLAVSLRFTLLNEGYFKRVLDKQNIYEQIPQLMMESAKQTVAHQSKDATANNFLAQLNTEQLSQLITAILPENYIKTQVETNLDKVFAFLNSQTADLNLIVDLIPIKQMLNTAGGKDAVLQLINSFPNCTDEQLQILSSVIKSEVQPTTAIPLCKPPVDKLQANLDYVFNSMTQLTTTMPDTISLMGNGPNTSLLPLQSSPIFHVYRIFRGIMSLIPWFAGTLALFIFLLTLRSGKAMFSCLGMPMLISGILGALSSLLIMFGGSRLIATMQSSGSPIDTLIKNISHEAVSQFSYFGLAICAISFIIGLVFLLFSKIARQ